MEGDKKLDRILCATFSSDGKVLVLAGGGDDNGYLNLFAGDAFRDKTQWKAQGGAIRHIAFSPRGDLIAYCSDLELVQGRSKRLTVRGGLEIREYPSGKQLPVKVRPNYAKHCEFSADGKYVAISCWDRIELWHVRRAKLAARFTDDTGKFKQLVAFSPDGKILAGCNDDGDVVFWKIPNLEK